MFKSNFDLDEKVLLNIDNDIKLFGVVTKISFTNYGKILYDVKLEDMTVKDVDSVWVEKL